MQSPNLNASAIDRWARHAVLAVMAVCWMTYGVACAEDAPSLATVVEKASRGHFAYSFTYVAPPPEGRRLEALFVDKTDKPCDLFAYEGVPSDFDSLKVTLAGSQLGGYGIRAAGTGEGPGFARVDWQRVRKGREEGHAYAISGNVTYVSGPTSEAEWKDVRSIRMEASVIFEVDPVVASECEGGMDMKTGEQSSSCTCRRLGGKSFKCEAPSNLWCCNEHIGETRDVYLTVEGTACPAQCAFTEPELATYCRDLL